MSAAVVESLLDEHGAHVVFDAVRPLLSDARVARIDEVLEWRLTSLTVAIENLYDPHNGAAAIRSVEAFGLAELWAIEAANPFPVSADVTIGADKWITVNRQPTAKRCAEELRARGFRIAAATPSGAVAVGELAMDEPWAVWFGNEREGLSEEAIALADARIFIPMHGFTRSFNLSVSVALVVRELADRRRRALGRSGDLSEARRQRLRARFAAIGIRGLTEIVARYVSE